jgi:hypothetical protein
MNFDIQLVGDMLKTQTGWYFIDRYLGELVQTDIEFNRIRNYSAKGRGPHELTRPLSITRSQNYLFLIDAQRKIVRFDESLNPIGEMITEHPPFSIHALNDSTLWMGTVHHEYEDVYQVEFLSDTFVRVGVSRKVENMAASIVFLTSNSAGNILRYRLFGNHIDLYHFGTLLKSFKNVSQPDFPEVNLESPVPIYKTKTHNIAFLTESLACFLSGDIAPRRQPIQCFDFDGNLISRYVIPTPSPFTVYSDSLLYTYSPETNHIYVYDLGF